MRVKVDIEVSHTDVTLFSLFNVRLLLRNVEECWLLVECKRIVGCEEDKDMAIADYILLLIPTVSM